MNALNKRLCGFIVIISCILAVFCSGCLYEVQEDFLTYKAQREPIKKVAPPQQGVIEETPHAFEQGTVNAASDQQGKGYLKEGSTVSLGVLDGDEELKVLEKIKRLEKELEKEKEKREALEESLAEMKAAKDKVEEEFIITKKELEGIIKSLSEDIEAWETQKKELEEKAVSAEQQIEMLKEKILSIQIAETKAQQELYKLKIERLEEKQEE
jgi:membrane-associated HD superfamily phosphohydrolase